MQRGSRLKVQRRLGAVRLAGNAFLANKRAADAAKSYTKAIELDPENAVYYCNRAAAFTMQEDFSSAVEDCLAAISLNPKYAKAFSRLGYCPASFAHPHSLTQGRLRWTAERRKGTGGVQPGTGARARQRGLQELHRAGAPSGGAETDG